MSSHCCNSGILSTLLACHSAFEAPASLLDTLHWILCWASLCDLLFLAPLYFEIQTDRSHLYIRDIKELHRQAAEDLRVNEEAKAEMEQLLSELQQLLVGVSIMQDLTMRAKDSLVSFGERLSTRLFAAFLRKEVRLQVISELPVCTRFALVATHDDDAPLSFCNRALLVCSMPQCPCATRYHYCVK